MQSYIVIYLSLKQMILPFNIYGTGFTLYLLVYFLSYSKHDSFNS